MANNFNFKSSIKTVEWCSTRKCNYNCYYCLTKKDRTRNIKKEKSLLIMRQLLPLLKPNAHIIIGGSGEPFLTNDFFKIIELIAAHKHRLTMVTNFSASTDTLLKFIKIAGSSLILLSASMHISEVDIDVFLKKAKIISKFLNQPLEISVVGIMGKLEELGRIGELVKEQRFNFTIKENRQKQYNVAENYSKQERIILNKYKTGKAADLKNNEKRLCSAGKDYIVMDEDGGVWTCWPAKKINKSSYLGNILKPGKLNLLNEPIECSIKNCYNSAPAKEKIIIKSI